MIFDHCFSTDFNTVWTINIDSLLMASLPAVGTNLSKFTTPPQLYIVFKLILDKPNPFLNQSRVLSFVLR